MATQRVAVIGLGSMGFGMAQSLLRAGFAVAGCDVDPRPWRGSQQKAGTAPRPRPRPPRMPRSWSRWW